jgi:hypothetical protein
MNRQQLVAAFEPSLGPKLSVEIIDEYLQIRRDSMTGTLGRSSPGKFVEIFVQICQFLAKGRFELHPNVEAFLSKEIENLTLLNDGVRICAGRIARSMYALRNKRSIAHKNEIDPNLYDLSYLLAGSSWILAELLRTLRSISMEQAGLVIKFLQVPAGKWVEDIAGRRLVHGDFGIREEILILLHSYYPETCKSIEIQNSLNRRSGGAVRKQLSILYREKLIDGTARKGFVLTWPGHERATELLKE